MRYDSIVGTYASSGTVKDIIIEFVTDDIYALSHQQ